MPSKCHAREVEQQMLTNLASIFEAKDLKGLWKPEGSFRSLTFLAISI